MLGTNSPCNIAEKIIKNQHWLKRKSARPLGPGIAEPRFMGGSKKDPASGVDLQLPRHFRLLSERMGEWKFHMLAPSCTSVMESHWR